MTILSLLHKIRNRWKKICLQPIHIYDMHHVSVSFDAASMNRGDWMQLDEFKNRVNAMRQNGVEFLSITDAHRCISHDWIRRKKYVVLAFDDGYASLKEILPWLEEQRIPATLFINGKYLDGKSYRKNPKERYLTKDELFALTSPLIEIGSHGWEHISILDMTEEEFAESVDNNMHLIHQHPRFIPYYAYTYGAFTSSADNFLRSHNLTPVYVDGKVNYNESMVLHRELMK